MGKVISGEYTGCKVDLADKYKCLYVKYDGGAVPLDSIRVAKYQLKEVDHSPLLSFTHIVLVEWENGKKSVIGIEKPYMTWLVSGCETAIVEDPSKITRGLSCTVLYVIAGFLLLLVFLSILSDTSEHNDSVVSVSGTELSYEPWDGENIIATVTDALVSINPIPIQEFEDGTTLISGKLYNNTNMTLKNVKLFIGVYSNGEKVDSCLSVLQFALQPGGKWNYRAACGGTNADNLEYVVESVYLP